MTKQSKCKVCIFDLHSGLPELPGYLSHLGPGARHIIYETQIHHRLSKILEDSGAPILKSSPFEWTEKEFMKALEDAGIRWEIDDRNVNAVFYWGSEE